ncbi:cytochrome b561 and DOMON domain-containing protein [Chlorella sorokiniana]|uniref:Cytochrome b561 and DOMON domain-containing protein n=1 Tax=Chlorella sorokiniana TaxID=3076 RepID=A0A2P6TV66_CHLSO|nr:cytochrome b561 and DOMON domain-containing protein [Chlorella sorokiniana]|eukprot:PRW57965.1 cytochrome b561 and DOMON domain-containing protein [Chlorella sorokiniana]
MDKTARWAASLALCAVLLWHIAAAAPAAAAGSGCTLALAANQQQSFARCALIDRVGNSFHLLWNTEATNDPTKLLLTVGLNASSSGYVSVGFPSQPGLMTDATAMILQTCTAGEAGCPSGAKLVQWYMSGLKQSDVKPDSRLPITNVEAGIPAAGQLVGSFQMEIPAPGHSAAGRLMSDGTPRQHFADGHAALPLLAYASPTATATNDTANLAESSTGQDGTDGASYGAVYAEVQGSADNNALKAAHAWLGVIGWGVFVPIGIVVARSFKDTLPTTWFHLHRALVALGLLLGTISLGTGFHLGGGWTTTSYDQSIHRDLGMACTVLGAAQLSSIVVRPGKGHKHRRAWELCHHWAGRAAAIIAIANIYWGCLYMWDLGVWAWASYTSVLSAIVLTSVAKDSSDFIWRKRHAADRTGHEAELMKVELGSGSSTDKLPST